MALRKSYYIGLVAITCFATLTTAPRDVAAPVPPVVSKVKVRMAFEKADCTPEDTVKLTESVPAAWKTEVKSITHRVLRVGRYEPKAGGLVNLRLEEFLKTDGLFANEDDGGLTFIVGYSAPRMLPQVGADRHGRTFEFKPKRLGIFLIYTEWGVKGESEAWLSAPAVLVVNPPPDLNDRPAIKLPWLEE